MARYANYQIEKETDKILVIRDVGPWTDYFTVTNDAENVVRRLVEGERLKPGMRLFYYDSDGAFDELVVENGKFVRFAPGDLGVLQ